MTPARVLLLLFLPSVLLLLSTAPFHRRLPCTSRNCILAPAQQTASRVSEDVAGEDGEGSSSLRIVGDVSHRRGGSTSRFGRFVGCGMSGRPTDEAESAEQLRLWQALKANRVEFRVSRRSGVKLPSGHRATDLVLHRRMCDLEHTNRDGVKGFGEGLLVAPLNPASKAKHETLHIPEQLMSALPHEDASWSFDSCAIVGNSGRLLH
eukprot:CAMPEP_0177792560 /NCGR_PEP_ID=MMETSP0491_2-20121128/24592_1 /TAXON_ID=63592 /ORGANISM="Tetraselmis chuii, Strain PLY429" /LENGTH=206 /DNA_ID=CAMNT_0019314987 /DNA_START=82 /DNA_END=699 /DNA_ORIENTATION=-